MTNIDLRQYLENECSENPFLEVESDEDIANNTQSEDTEKSQSENDDATNNSELDNVLSEGTALSDDPTTNSDYENRFETDVTILKTPSNTNLCLSGRRRRSMSERDGQYV
jgi:DNA-directed RNA polymerase specialized sigma54-like protein